MQLLANFFYPAFMAPYFTPLVMPLMLIWILGSEWKTLVHLLEKDTNRDEAITFKKRWVFIVVLFANFVSSSVGMLFALFLPTGFSYVYETWPDGTTHNRTVLGDLWGTYAIVSFVLAYALSIIIEGGVLRITNRFQALNPWKKSWILNSVSYGGIMLYLLLGYLSTLD